MTGVVVASQTYRTLGIHPTARGFGWAVCEGPFSLVEAGVCTPIRHSRRFKSIREFERLLARFQPAELVLEALDGERRGDERRTKRLALDLIACAADRGLSVEALKRDAVQKAFEAVGARTREEIAEAVARHFPPLAHRLPPKRRAWDKEDRQLAMFSAAAVVIANFQNGATALLDELRDAA